MITINRSKVKGLRYVKQAQTKDDGRPVLKHYRVNGYVAACDGYRLHATPNDVNSPLPDGVYQVDALPTLKAGETVQVNTTDNTAGSYPDLSIIIPRGKPVFEIAVNAGFLKEAVNGLDGAVVLRFYNPTTPMEVYGKIDDDTPAYALVMPMYIAETEDHNWKP